MKNYICTSTNIPNFSSNHCKMYLLKMAINKTGKAFYSWIIIGRRLFLLLHPLLLLFTMLNLLATGPLSLLLLPHVCFSRSVEHPSLSPTFKTYFIVKFLLFIVMPYRLFFRNNKSFRGLANLIVRVIAGFKKKMSKIMGLLLTTNFGCHACFYIYFSRDLKLCQQSL